MSTDDPLTQRDEAVLDYQPEQAPEIDSTATETTETECDHEQRFAQLEDAINTLQADLTETREQLQKEREEKRNLVAKINQLESQIEGNHEMVGSTNLEKYSQMTEEEREELLPTSKRRAVEIYEHWDELAWTASGNELLETKARANAKNQPSKIKYRLENYFDEDLAWNEVYRTMKAVAKLSGGEEHTDGQNRLHITGGDFEFHVVPTADNSETRRVLKKVSQ